MQRVLYPEMRPVISIRLDGEAERGSLLCLNVAGCDFELLFVIDRLVK